MKTFKIITEKSNYLHKSSWEELFVITEYWQSDILYFKNELRFLQGIIVKYFPQLLKHKSIISLNPLDEHFIHLLNTADELSQGFEKHREHIEELIDNPFAYDNDEFRKEHEILEHKFTAFVLEFQEEKEQIYSVIKKSDSIND